MKAVVSLFIASVAHAGTVGDILLSQAMTAKPVKDVSALIKQDPLLTISSSPRSIFGGRYPWHSVTSTVFCVGENVKQGGGVSNYRSSWDAKWMEHFGSGLGQNPFYVALPYNDLIDDHTTKPEAATVIPWFRNSFVRSGQSVCKGRWIAIKKGGRMCYAQWEDCGPFRTDCASYVFGRAAPSWNKNNSAGIDVSPAVQQYLGLSGVDSVDWKFCEFRNVPSQGPWAAYGTNNTFVLLREKR
jgi:hypothetical protein